MQWDRCGKNRSDTSSCKKAHNTLPETSKTESLFSVVFFCDVNKLIATAKQQQQKNRTKIETGRLNRKKTPFGELRVRCGCTFLYEILKYFLD